MKSSLSVLLSIILAYGHLLDEHVPVEADETCLLQSNVIPQLHGKSAKEKMTKAPLTSVAIDRLSKPTSLLSLRLDDSSQLLLCLAAVVFVAAIMCVIFASHHMGDYHKMGGIDDGRYVPGDTSGDDWPADWRPAGTPRVLSRSRMPKLNPALAVPEGKSMVYYLPDISHQRKPLEAFSVLGHPGQQEVMGVVAKQGDDDPGIVLHASSNDGGAGVPLAFISTKLDAIRNGKMRIAWPSAEHPQGEMFGMLELHNDGFKVTRDGQLLLWLEGSPPNFRLSTGIQGSGLPVGSTSAGGSNVQLRLEGGADTALVVLCILGVMQLRGSSGSWVHM